MKLLVTGGAGFIGSNFIYYWLKNHPKDKIKVLDALTFAGNKENLAPVMKKIEFVEGDITDRGEVKEALKGVDTVVHFAAESHVDRSIFEPGKFWKTNVDGTRILLEESKLAKVPRFHHISCYDTKTRAFTKKGLKNYKQIKKGDLVLSLNPKTRKAEWKPVEKVIIQDYKGKMIEMKSKVVDFLVTPNHRMLLQNKKSRSLVFKEADTVKNYSRAWLPYYYQWEGNVSKKIAQFGKHKKEFMYLLGIFIGDGFTGYQEKKVLSKTGLDRQSYLQIGRDTSGKFVQLGYVGENKHVISKSWRIFLDIPESDGCRLSCEEALTKLGVNWHAHSGKAGTHLYFTSKEYFKIFEDCGKLAKNKKIPDWAMDAPVELLRHLWNGLMDSDGSRRRVFFTVSPTLAYQFMELSVKLGYNPTLGRRYTETEYKGRTIKGWSYVVSFGSRQRILRKEISKEVDYDGKIWCLKVKDNKNFLIERNGRTAFCGNTDEVYGELPLDSDERFSEKTPYAPRPDNLYAVSKAEADRVVREFYKDSGMFITISNCSNNYGPYQFPEKYIPILVTNLIDGLKAPVHGDGKNVRDWIHTDDHAKAVDLILEKGKPGETYLIGSRVDVPNIFIAEHVVNLSGKDEAWIRYVPDRHSNDRRYAIDSRKIIQELGWKPSITKSNFDDGLKDTINWYKKNKEWWKPLLTRKAVISDGDSKVYAFIEIDRELGKTKFMYGEPEEQNKVVKLGQKLIEEEPRKIRLITQKLKSHEWFKKSRPSIQKKLLDLIKISRTSGFVEDLANRPEEVGGFKQNKIVKFEYSPDKKQVYGVAIWFEVEDKKKNKHLEGFYSWAMGVKSGAKMLVLVRYRDKLTHIALSKEHKFAVGSEMYNMPGGFPRKNESVFDLIHRKLEDDLGIDVKDSHIRVGDIIGLGRIMPDPGMTNNHPFLYAVVLDLTENIFPPIRVGEVYETGGKLVLWPLERLSELVNKVDDSYFLSSLARLQLSGATDIKLQ